MVAYTDRPSCAACLDHSHRESYCYRATAR